MLAFAVVSGEFRVRRRPSGSGGLTGSALRSLSAGDGARTRDIKLGKLALYQLSYSRIWFPLSGEPEIISE